MTSLHIKECSDFFSSMNGRCSWTQIKILNLDMSFLFLHKAVLKFSDKGILFIKDPMIMLKNHKAPNKE